jgi:alcohol dehydrogenase
MKALVLNEHGDLDQLHVVTDKPVPKATPGPW